MGRQSEMQAFLQGWTDGAASGEQTRSQAEKRQPAYGWREIDAYCQGTVDGSVGDSWRKERIETALEER